MLAAPGQTGAPATPPGAFTDTIDLTSSTGVVNLRTIADAEGYTGHSDATITFRVPNGVTIRGLASGFGIDTGVWPSSHTIALSLVVQSGGVVDGGGGNGGTEGGDGQAGGDAIYCRVPLTGGVTINSGGTVRGGGGGGGAGAGTFDFDPFAGVTGSEPTLGGGGGGGGAPNGAGGAAGAGDTPGGSGSTGTTSGGGGGGAGGSGTHQTATSGGSGGGFGAAGSAGTGSGGAAGYAVRKNGHAVTVTNNGTMTGTAG